MESVGNSLPEVIMTLLKQWHSISKPRQRELLRICMKKYGDLERIHNSFLAIIDELCAVLTSAFVSDRPVDAGFVEEIWAFEERRRVGRPARQAGYIEAQVFAEAAPARFAGIIRKIPPKVEAAVKVFMESYARYFEHDGRYDHDVARAIRETKSMLSHAIRSGSTTAADTDVNISLKYIRNLRDELDLSWIKVSRDYYRLHLALLDHGIVLE